MENTGYVLAIDTATENLGLCLWHTGNSTMWAFSEVVHKAQAGRLHEEVGNLLSQAGATAGDLAAVAVTRGPGSFTGIRVGMAAAQGFADALNLPLATLSTFDVLAAQARQADAAAGRPLAVWVEAWGGAVYQQLYHADGMPMGAAISLPAAEAAASLPDNALVLGNGAHRHKDELDAPRQEALAHLPAYVDPGELAKMGWDAVKAADYQPQGPLYIGALNYTKRHDQPR